MPRPEKTRRVNTLPQVRYYKPAGIPIRNLEEVCLTVEEFEAIRLKDLEGLEQEESAEMMNISRPTFHRVLNSGRHKIAEALFSNKAIRIGGGNFTIPPCHFRCSSGHEWDIAFEVDKRDLPQVCPTCQTPGITCNHPFESKDCTKTGLSRCCQLGTSALYFNQSLTSATENH